MFLKERRQCFVTAALYHHIKWIRMAWRLEGLQSSHWWGRYSWINLSQNIYQCMSSDWMTINRYLFKLENPAVARKKKVVIVFYVWRESIHLNVSLMFWVLFPTPNIKFCFSLAAEIWPRFTVRNTVSRPCMLGMYWEHTRTLLIQWQLGPLPQTPTLAVSQRI